MSKDIKPRGRPKMTWNHCPKETIPFSLPPPNDVRKYIIVGGFKYSYKDRTNVLNQDAIVLQILYSRMVKFAKLYLLQSMITPKQLIKSKLRKKDSC